MLCSPEFVRAPTMSKLLRFLVDYKLLQEGKPLTAYAVAVDGLGRDDSFDTQIDSYPRVQIGRLRRILDHFYLREKSEYQLYIPYQNYEIILGKNEAAGDADTEPGETDAQFSEPPGAIDTAPGSGGGGRGFGRGALLAALAVLILLVIATIFFWSNAEGDAATTISYPSVVVQPVEGITSSSARTKIEMTQSYLIGALEKFDQIRVLDKDSDPASRSQYFLETSILDDSAERIQLRLVAADTREVLWSDHVDIATPIREADFDNAVIAIAGSHGKISQHELTKYHDDYTPGYPCLLQFHQFMRLRDPGNLKPSLRCMNDTAKQFPDDAYLMSMLAIAKNIAAQFGVADKIDGIGEDFAMRASKLDSNSASATFAVAQSAFFEGDCRKGMSWGERAVALNPLNSRIMGYLGIYMLACGIPKGEVYATRAVEMDDNVDAAVSATVAIEMVRRGEAKAAQELSTRYMNYPPGGAVGLEISYILSSAMLNEKNEARKVWRLLAKRSGFPETAPPGKVLERWIHHPVIVRKLEADFEKADLY